MSRISTRYEFFCSFFLFFFFLFNVISPCRQTLLRESGSRICRTIWNYFSLFLRGSVRSKKSINESLYTKGKCLTKRTSLKPTEIVPSPLVVDTVVDQILLTRTLRIQRARSVVQQRYVSRYHHKIRPRIFLPVAFLHPLSYHVDRECLRYNELPRGHASGNSPRRGERNSWLVKSSQDPDS